MPAFPWEIEEAMKEGVEIIDGFAVQTFDMGKSGVTAANCLQVERIEKDLNGRVVPVLRDVRPRKLKVDWVLTAVGSSPDYSFLEKVPERVPVLDGVPLVRLGGGTGLTIPVIAGGDMASGPATVIEAVAAGKEAALYLYRKLVGNAPVSIRYRSRRTLEPWANYPDSLDFRKRRREIILTEEMRKTSFKEVYGGYAVGTAREEAERCMRCDWPLMRESKVKKFFRNKG
jgi:NADPH-dependent glutamate synthase beta subunit-like oxidoreductase